MNINDTMTINGAAPSAQKSHAEIIAEYYHNTAATQYVRKLLDYLDAAHKREVEDAERRGHHAATKACCETIEKAGPFYDAESVGNAAKLREALESIANNLERRLFARYPSSATDEWMMQKAREALALPPRNCDVGSVEEQLFRFRDYCLHSRKKGCGWCHNPPVNLMRCVLTWAQMQYEAEKGDAKWSKK